MPVEITNSFRKTLMFIISGQPKNQKQNGGVDFPDHFIIALMSGLVLFSMV